MTTEVSKLLALPTPAGLPAAWKNITPPITSIKAAMGGTRFRRTNLTILSNNLKKSQSSHSPFTVPGPQGTKGAAVAEFENKEKNNTAKTSSVNKFLKAFFFILLFRFDDLID